MALKQDRGTTALGHGVGGGTRAWRGHGGVGTGIDTVRVGRGGTTVGRRHGIGGVGRSGAGRYGG